MAKPFGKRLYTIVGTLAGLSLATAGLGLALGWAEEATTDIADLGGDPVVEAFYESGADDTLAAIQGGIAENAAQYEARTYTTEDGTRIQRTPTEPDSGVTQNALYEYNGFNLRYLNADNRGCTACHSDLEATVDNLGGKPHQQLRDGLGLETQLRQCVTCHNYAVVLYDDVLGMDNLMHSLHGGSNEAFKAMGGDCMSCHYSLDGEMVLWDDVKYDLLRGITDIDADALDASSDFTWDQTYVVHDHNWVHDQYHESLGPVRYALDQSGAKPDPEADGIYDEWTITFEGDLENPCTMTLQELIDTFGIEETTMTECCDAGPVGSNLIGNYEIAGINLNKVMEYLGVSDDVTILTGFAPNGHSYSTPAEQVRENGAYLVLEKGGEPLTYGNGFPVAIWTGGASAWCYEQQLCNLQFRSIDLPSDEFPDWFFNTGLEDESGFSDYKPTVGVFHLLDGQVFENTGEPISFEGYAYAYEDPIAALEFSFDGGNTWLSCDTPNDNVTNWVHWQFDWTPPADGAYVLNVRAVADTGDTTDVPLKYLINVQTSDAAETEE